MTQGGDDWDPNDYDPGAPPKTNGKGKQKAPARPRPALTIVSPGNGDAGQAWRRDLAETSQGQTRKTAANVAILLANHLPKNTIRHNSFAERVVIGKCPNLPRAGEASLWAPPAPGDISSSHVEYFVQWLAQKEHVVFAPQSVEDGMIELARRNAFNPLTDYLDGLRWDGRVRLNEWLCVHLGAENSAHSRRVASMFLISAVARAYAPGCKVDGVLTLVGAQGIGKTTALEIMFGDSWFLPDLPDFRDKDSMQLLAGIWGAQADETPTGKASIERANAFYTRRADVFRPSYGRHTVKRSRTCVFVSSTNSQESLSDPTGARRFLMIRCTKPLINARLRDERDQLWAEAVLRYKDKEQWHPRPDELEMFRAEQDKHYAEDHWAEPISAYVNGKLTVTYRDIFLSLGAAEAIKCTRADQLRVRDVMRRLGWDFRRTTEDDGYIRRWHAPGT